MTNYIKTAFTKPKEIYIGRNMKNAHFFSILLLLVSLLTVFTLFQFFPAFRSMNEDIQEVKQAIPEFALEDNTLTSDSESFLYQTDTLFLYFDPEDEMSQEMIERNVPSTPAPISIGILYEELTLNVMGQSFSLQYSDFTNFTTEDLETIIDSFGHFSPGFIFLFILFLFVFNGVLYAVQFFPIVLFANIISVYRRTGLRFYQTVKVALLATIPPITILYAVNAFLFPVAYQFELLLATSVVIYYRSMTEMKKRMNKTNE